MSNVIGLKEPSTTIWVPFGVAHIGAQMVVDTLERVVMERSGERARKIAARFHDNGDVWYNIVFERMGEFAQPYAVAVGPNLDDVDLDLKRSYSDYGLATYTHSLGGFTDGKKPDASRVVEYFEDIADIVQSRLD